MKYAGDEDTRSRTLVLLALAMVLVSIVAQTWWSVSQDYRQTVAAETTNGLATVRLENEAEALRRAMDAQRVTP